MARRSSKKVVYAALLGNVLVALTKFAAAGLTGSSAMVSEAIHSLVDTGNEILLLYGLRRAARPPDELHPLGHGRELYFWSFIVTLLIFALGAGVSVYEGISHVIAPVPISNSIGNYVVLGRPRWKWSRRSARSRAPIRASSARTVCSRCISAPTRSSRRSVSTSWTRSPPPTWRRSSPRSRSASGASIRRSCCC